MKKKAQTFSPPPAGETPDPCHLSGPEMISYTLRHHTLYREFLRWPEFIFPPPHPSLKVPYPQQVVSSDQGGGGGGGGGGKDVVFHTHSVSGHATRPVRGLSLSQWTSEGPWAALWPRSYAISVPLLLFITAGPSKSCARGGAAASVVYHCRTALHAYVSINTNKQPLHINTPM